MARRRDQSRGLKAPMLSIVRGRPGVVSRDALAQLKREGRVSYGVTLADALSACEQLARDGLIEGGPYKGWTCVEAAVR